MKNNLLRYWAAMNASAFDAAIHAVNITFGIAGLATYVPATLAINPLTLQQMLLVFLFAFGRSILGYLDAHPIAALLPAEKINPKPVGPEQAPI